MQKLIDLADEIVAALETLESDLDSSKRSPHEVLDVLSSFVNGDLKDLVRTSNKLADELREEEEKREELESRIEELESEQ